MSIQKDLENSLGMSGRLLGSKGRLSFYNPRSLFVFNAGVYVNKWLAWKGDLNLSNPEDMRCLSEIANRYQVPLNILQEVYAFSAYNKNKLSVNEYDKLATARIIPNHGCLLSEKVAKYYELNTNGLPLLKQRYVRIVNEDTIVQCNVDNYENFKFDKYIKIDWENITIEKKGKTPLFLFYEFLSTNLSIPVANINVSTVYVSNKVGMQLKTLQRDYYKKHYPIDLYGVQKELSLTWFDIGPNVVYFPGMDEDTVYVRD